MTLRRQVRRAGGAFLALGLVWVSACGSNSSTPSGSGGSGAGGSGAGGSGGVPEQTGSACKAPSDCYPNLDGGTLKGQVQCLTQVQGGYCTHLCQTDADCCAVPGECLTNIKEVCATFQSTGQKMCFLSCETADLTLDGGTVSDQEFCQRAASPSFICRATGGGQPRRVCLPGACGVGAGCTADTDCATGLTCIKTLKGGYCSKSGCQANADCPQGSLCVKNGTTTYCAKSCQTDTDCSFCRSWDLAGTCAANASFVEATTTGSVCLPPS